MAEVCGLNDYHNQQYDAEDLQWATYAMYAGAAARLYDSDGRDFRLSMQNPDLPCPEYKRENKAMDIHLLKACSINKKALACKKVKVYAGVVFTTD